MHATEIAFVAKMHVLQWALCVIGIWLVDSEKKIFRMVNDRVSTCPLITRGVRSNVECARTAVSLDSYYYCYDVVAAICYACVDVAIPSIPVDSLPATGQFYSRGTNTF